MSNELMTNGQFQAVEKRMLELGMNIQQVKREISFAIQAINKSEKLLQTTDASRLAAVMNVANIGLTLNPTAKEAYLLPRYDSVTRSMICCLEPSYIGLVKLLTDAGSVKSIIANLVYENDEFSIDLADNVKPITHKPTMKEKGAALGVYALATLVDGTRQPEWMTIDEVNQIAGRSETHKAFLAGKIKSSTWATDFAEMARKTVVKRIYKYLPHTEQAEAVQQAIELDNQDYKASDKQIELIENLLNSSTLDQAQRDMLDMETAVMNPQRAGEVINFLMENQLDPISAGHAYGQTDIKKHLQKLA